LQASILGSFTLWEKEDTNGKSVVYCTAILYRHPCPWALTSHHPTYSLMLPSYSRCARPEQRSSVSRWDYVLHHALWECLQLHFNYLCLLYGGR
jgi:hypothetical protein